MERLPDSKHNESKGPVDVALLRLCQVFATIGGVMFIGLMSMSLVSIIGLKLRLGGVTGDIELMQVGTAVAVTAFLPYCTFLGEHLKVDFFTESLNDLAKRILDGFSELLLSVMIGLLAWMTTLAVLDAYENQEVTTLVSLPIWIPMALLVPSLVLMAVCALWRTVGYFIQPQKGVNA